MPESSPISMFCAQIVGIQGMSDLWGSRLTYIQLGQTFLQLSLDVILLDRCTGVFFGFFNRALSAIVCERDAFFFEKKIIIRRYEI